MHAYTHLEIEAKGNACGRHLVPQMDAFRAKNKVATKAASATGTLDVRSIKALATSLPQYRSAVMVMNS